MSARAPRPNDARRRRTGDTSPTPRPGTASGRSCYAGTVSPPRSLDELLGRPLPDLTLSDARGAAWRLRQFVPHRPLVLFFYVMNGTPG